MQFLGDGYLANFDLVLAGLDNREARVWLSASCRRVEKILIDGVGTGKTSLQNVNLKNSALTEIKVDGDIYTMLEIPQLSKNPYIIERIPTNNNNFWIKLKDIYAIEDNIMVRVETAFKKFFQEYPIENIQNYC